MDARSGFRVAYDVKSETNEYTRKYQETGRRVIGLDGARVALCERVPVCWMAFTTLAPAISQNGQNGKYTDRYETNPAFYSTWTDDME